MLYWHSLSISTTTGNFLISRHQLVNFIFIADARDDKRCWSRIKSCIICGLSLLIIVVIILKRADQASLCADATIVLKVIHENRFFWNYFQPIIQCIILTIVQITLSPVKVAIRQSDLFWNLIPVTSHLQGIDDVIWTVATTSSEGVCFGTWVNNCNCRFYVATIWTVRLLSL